MERFQYKYIIKKLDSPVFGYLFNVQELGSFNFGKTFGYYGNGKYFKTEEEAENYIKEMEKEGV